MSYDDPYPDDLGAGGATSNVPPNRRPQARSTRTAGSSGGDHTKQAIEEGRYTEVKTRIQLFYAAYPTGALVTTKVKVHPFHEFEDGKSRVMVKARAYRTPDDPHPGEGTSWMTIPGTTPYTNNSEVENCETSAWGRAIAAVGIAIDQGIATAQEIRMKGGGEIEAPSRTAAQQLADAAAAAAGAQQAPETSPEPDGQTGTTAPAEAAPEPAPEPSGAPESTEKGTEPSADQQQALADLRAAARASVGLEPEEEPLKMDIPVAAMKQANEAMTEEQVAQGLTYEEFKRIAREKFLTNGLIATTARELVERKQLPEVGGVKELDNQQRLTLLYAAMVRSMDEAPK